MANWGIFHIFYLLLLLGGFGTFQYEKKQKEYTIITITNRNHKYYFENIDLSVILCSALIPLILHFLTKFQEPTPSPSGCKMIFVCPLCPTYYIIIVVRGVWRPRIYWTLQASSTDTEGARTLKPLQRLCYCWFGCFQKNYCSMALTGQ